MVRSSVVEVFGSVVVQARSQRSGFTPGFASRLWLADGRTAFVKAANSRRSWLVESYALEAANLELLPAQVSAPRVRRRRDLTDGDTGWLVLSSMTFRVVRRRLLGSGRKRTVSSLRSGSYPSH
jgi:hypothetical protein